MHKRLCVAFVAGPLYLLVLTSAMCAETTLLNASYEPTRRFYSAVNKAFAARWQQQHGSRIVIYQSHAGSGAQARAVSFGLEADVVTLALAYDVDAIVERAGLIAQNWQQRLPDNRVPFTQGQPKADSRLAGSCQAGCRRRDAQPKTVRRRALELHGSLGLCHAPLRQ